jgi:hypothetical protein
MPPLPLLFLKGCINQDLCRVIRLAHLTTSARGHTLKSLAVCASQGRRTAGVGCSTWVSLMCFFYFERRVFFLL